MALVLLRAIFCAFFRGAHGVMEISGDAMTRCVSGHGYYNTRFFVQLVLIVVLYAKSFKQNLAIIHTHMAALETFTCPWCHAQNQMQINQLTVTDTVDLKGLGHEEAIVSQIPVYITRCRLCLEEYEPIKASDYHYITSNIQPKSNMLQDFRTKFPNQNDNIEAIFNNIEAITRPKKSIADRLFARNPHLHIFFTLDGKRSYIDCEQVKIRRKTILRGLYIGDI
jgi:hypothetical protein